MNRGSLSAVILAGGRGERLLPLTSDRPKCMVQVAGKPILAWQLEWLSGQGIATVVISCGYRCETVEASIGSGDGFGLTVRYAKEEVPLGRGGGLRYALGQMADEGDWVLVLNGDVLARPSVAAMLDRHVALGAVATVMVVPCVTDDAIADLDARDRITGFREKPRLPYWVNGGVYVVSPKIRTDLPERGDHERSTFPKLASEGKLGGYRHEGFWCSVDSAKDLAEADQALLGGFPG